MNAPLLTIEPPRVPAAETGAAFIGIDNGISGAMACLTPEGGVLCEPVIFQDLGREKLMDVDRNLALLERMIAATGLPKQRLIVVFEQSQIFPKVGCGCRPACFTCVTPSAGICSSTPSSIVFTSSVSCTWL
jgi:hypothetical protein